MQHASLSLGYPGRWAIWPAIAVGYALVFLAYLTSSLELVELPAKYIDVIKHGLGKGECIFCVLTRNVLTCEISTCARNAERSTAD
jgi:hypothetical protein